ncbi:MAG: ComF family protein [Rhodobacteraceae bacterium]|nr:ComF family protein [Paracoccaceae bacterium]
MLQAVKKGVYGAGGFALDFLLPMHCAACNARVAKQDAICSRCWSAVPFLSEPVCDLYGTPFSYELGEGALSARAIADPPLFDRARACAAYSGTARDLVVAFKFAKRRELADPLGRWMARAGRDLVEPGTLILPVPLHWTRLWRRRFNQAADLAKVVADEAGTTSDPFILQRARRTRQQVGLDAKTRDKNVRGAFRIRPGEEGRVAGKEVLLVDDVMTTGSTITACTKVLKRAGASKVNVLTFAMALDETREV